MEAVEEERKRRLQFMKKLFEESGGDEWGVILMYDIGEKLGFDRQTTDRITQYLSGENLLKFVSLGGGISITHWGVKEMEESLLNPTEPTVHFPAVNIINIGHMENSQIQQGGIGNAQSYVDNTDVEDLRKLISMIKDSSQRISFDKTNQQNLSSDLATIEAQLSSSQPKKNVIIECLKSIKTVFEGVASNIIAQGILTQLGVILLHLTTGI